MIFFCRFETLTAKAVTPSKRKADSRYNDVTLNTVQYNTNTKEKEISLKKMPQIEDTNQDDELYEDIQYDDNEIYEEIHDQVYEEPQNECEYTVPGEPQTQSKEYQVPPLDKDIKKNPSYGVNNSFEDTEELDIYSVPTWLTAQL